MNNLRKKLSLNYLKARQEFLEVANKDIVLHRNDNIIGRIGEAMAHSFLEQMGRQPIVVKHQSNPGYDIICHSDNATVSVKMITHENKTGSTSKIKHEWDEFIGIEIDRDLKVIHLGHIKRKHFDEFLENRNRSLEPNFSRTMFKENGIFNASGKLYNQKELKGFSLL